VHLGAVVKEGKGFAISVVLKGRTAFFHRPHPNDKADKGAIVTAVKLMEAGGFGSFSLSDHSDESAQGGGR
jgi:hypothetical protein